MKSKIVVAARASGVDAIDNVFFDLNDTDGFRNQAKRAKALGYTGKQIIHPSEISIANEVFAPSKEDLDWARRVVKAYDEATALGKGAIRVNGRLVDNVHYKAAKRVLQLELTTSSSEICPHACSLIAMSKVVYCRAQI